MNKIVRRSLVVAPLIRRGPRDVIAHLMIRTNSQRTHLRYYLRWVFCCLREVRMENNAVKPPFDIAADLDTPVSAFVKLGAFNPRFLLESVEGGERLARYSFIGFGKCLEVKLDADGLHDRRCEAAAARRTAPSCWTRCARRWPRAPRAAARRSPACRSPAASSAIRRYDVVRYFERLPSTRARRRRRCRTCTTSRPSRCWCSIT